MNADKEHDGNVSEENKMNQVIWLEFTFSLLGCHRWTQSKCEWGCHSYVENNDVDNNNGNNMVVNLHAYPLGGCLSF